MQVCKCTCVGLLQPLGESKLRQVLSLSSLLCCVLNGKCDVKNREVRGSILHFSFPSNVGRSNFKVESNGLQMKLGKCIQAHGQALGNVKPMGLIIIHLKLSPLGGGG